MKTRFLTLAAALASLVLVGCVSSHQIVPFPDQSKTVSDPTKGRIYVFRPANSGGAVAMEIFDDGKLVGITGAAGYLCWERPPGQTVISAKAENMSSVNLPVQAGKAHYIFQHMAMGWVQARNRLEIVSEEEGLKILKKCKPPKIAVE